MADDGEENDRFGDSVDISNGLLVFGAPGDHANGEDSGSAYIFDAETGLQIFKLLPTDGAAGDKFGSSVSIDNGLVVVGAWADDEGTGAAYIFDALTGLQTHKLTASNKALDSHFGWSVTIDDGLVGVGAGLDDSVAESAGAAYVFDAETGVELQKITLATGLEWEQFGFSVDMHQGQIAVGASWGSGGERYAGAAYIFDAMSGSFVKKFIASDGEEGDEFGFSISLDNGFIVVGAPTHDNDVAYASGAAYIFDTSTGERLYKLGYPDPFEGDNFGYSVAIDQGLVVVGRPQSRFYWAAHTFGTAFVYDVATGKQIAELRPRITRGYVGFFGSSVAVEDGAYVVGAPVFYPQEVRDIGAAFVLNATFCSTDLNQDGILNFFDISIFFNAFINQDLIADENHDEQFDQFDWFSYLSAYNLGCP